MNTETLLVIAGYLQILLALIHIFFPRYFKWKEEFAHVSLMNRQMMYYHSFFIALTLFLIGLLSVIAAKELVSTALGQQVCFGIGFFWAVRLFVQFFGYSSDLWKSKRFETFIHILFSLLWIFFSSVFLCTALSH